MTAPEYTFPRRFKLAGTAAERFFVPQPNEYSCGPACLATVARLYGAGVDYAFFRNKLAPSPETGVPNARMKEMSDTHLPATGAGEEAYAGGIAVANILLGGEGHYVVFLCHEGGNVAYYDPYHHEIVENRLENIVWRSETGEYKNWAINFSPPPQDNSIQKWTSLASAPAGVQAKKLKLPFNFGRG